jgi:flagellar export protein FliJ
VQAEVERRRLALVEADRQIRVLEKLREKQEEAYRTDELRREQQMLDEQAILGFGRRKDAA